jgi:hypothetical protein
MVHMAEFKCGHCGIQLSDGILVPDERDSLTYIDVRLAKNT